VGIDGWNSMEENYAFLYNKEEKGKKKRVWVRCLVMGDLLAIGALDLKGQEEAPYKVQIKYVSIM
jgi:proteasome inhibitor subunit 1 (PI31)